MNSNPYQKYKLAKYETASPEQLLLMLYEGAIKFAGQARIAVVEEDLETANNRLKRTQAIINELMVTLDRDKGKEVADNLYKLYDYMYYRLVQANIKKDPEMIEEVIGLLKDLKESWEEAVKELKCSQYQQTGGLSIEG